MKEQTQKGRMSRVLEESRRVALAIQLGCTLDDVKAANYGCNTFEAESEEWLVLTDSEADAAWDESLDSYIDDCGMLDSMPELLRNYFDRGAWKRDARMDGRGHCLSSYDGSEYSSVGFVLFRVG